MSSEWVPLSLSFVVVGVNVVVVVIPCCCPSPPVFVSLSLGTSNPPCEQGSQQWWLVLVIGLPIHSHPTRRGSRWWGSLAAIATPQAVACGSGWGAGFCEVVNVRWRRRGGFSRYLPGRYPPAWVSWHPLASTYVPSLSPVITPVVSNRSS
jgi:hypothetical protein